MWAAPTLPSSGIDWDNVKATTVEGVFYSMQLNDTVLVLPVCSYVWVSKQWPHGPIQEYWLVGLIWCQVAAERLNTWFYAMGLALQLG